MLPCPPTPAAWAFWPAIRCVPLPIWEFRWWPSRCCTAKGYFQQHLDGKGVQSEDVQHWNPADFCTEEPARVTVSVEDRVVRVRAWRYDLVGRYGHVVPIYLLDTDLEVNSGWDRGLTDHLYGGDSNYRLQQEIVLGMGGARMAQRAGPSRECVPHERRPRGAAYPGAA